MAERIQIIEYNPAWPAQFARVKDVLSGALGDLVVSIDHIGSTSIPGLAAKDRIDVQITISEETAANIGELNSRLLQAGLGECFPHGDHVPPGDQSDQSHWQKFYLRGDQLECRSNIHIRTAGKRNQRYALLFRDYLRAKPEAAEAYLRLKKQIAKYLPESRAAYSDIKDPACDLIMLNAENWASVTSWKL